MGDMADHVADVTVHGLLAASAVATLLSALWAAEVIRACEDF